MDVAMKPMDGLEATRLIKARFAGARIVILTQHDSAPIRQAAINAGAYGFLTKENLVQIPTMISGLQQSP
jgi:DNA-binding NarL/FixJ family response regulator